MNPGELQHSLRVAGALRARFLIVLTLLLAACGDGDRPVDKSDGSLPVLPGDAAVPDACEGREEGAACGPRRYCVAGVCQVSRCGDGVRTGSEHCDDGNK